MSHLRTIFRAKPFSHPSPLRHRIHPRHNSSQPPPPPPQPHPRLQRILNHTPKFLHPYLSSLTSAPLTHLTSFLILHELTAILPLIGLTTWFHYGHGIDALPDWLVGEKGYVAEGVVMFGRWFRRRGWVGGEEGEVRSVGEEEVRLVDGEGGERETTWRTGTGSMGSRVILEVATAYAVTKVLLPVRVMVSLWGTPWFARRVLGVWRRLRGKGSS